MGGQWPLVRIQSPRPFIEKGLREISNPLFIRLLSVPSIIPSKYIAFLVKTEKKQGVLA